VCTAAVVVGIKVTPSPTYVETSTANAREMHLFVQQHARRIAAGATAFGFALQSGPNAPARDSVVLPGPVLELKRGQPVRIVVRNNLDEPTSIHWHGLEIESFPDGVPNWSGLGAKVYSQMRRAIRLWPRSHRRVRGRSRITRTSTIGVRSVPACTVR